jgi:hypothetical protein
MHLDVAASSLATVNQGILYKGTALYSWIHLERVTAVLDFFLTERQEHVTVDENANKRTAVNSIGTGYLDVSHNR